MCLYYDEAIYREDFKLPAVTQPSAMCSEGHGALLVTVSAHLSVITFSEST